MPYIIGNKTTAFGADPSKTDELYQFRYRVIDIGDIIPSHTDTLLPNPNYPSELQPRLRDRAASRTQIDSIAKNLNPRALLQDSGFIDTGAMIVGEDLVVESGNGRMLALRKAAKDYPEKYAQYKAMLNTIAEHYGIDKNKLKGIKQPVLVRERLTDVDRVKFAAEANVGAVMSMSPYEQALQDSKNISANIVSNIAVGEEQTIDQALRMKANDDIVKHFISNIPSTERAAIADEKGNINQQGMERLKLALFAKTYTGDAGKRLVRIFGESVDPYVKSIENAMFASLPDMAKAEGLIDAKQRDDNLSIAPDMAEVIDTYASLKATGITIPDYLAQQAMFEERLNPFQKKVLEHLDEIARKPKSVREMLRDTAQKIIESPPKGQISMIGVEPITKESLVYGVINKQRETIGKSAFQVAAAAAKGEGLEKSDTGGDESPGRLQPRMGEGIEAPAKMAIGASVQVGLKGLGKEAAQPGAGGKKETLIDVEKEKAREAAKPLPGQIVMDITKGVLIKNKKLVANPDNIPAAKAFVSELREKANEADKKAIASTESKAKILRQNARQARIDANKIEATIPKVSIIKPKPESKKKKPTLEELRAIMAKRSLQSKVMDLSRSHNITIKPSSPKVKRWLTDIGSADIIGIDTKSARRLNKFSASHHTPKKPKQTISTRVGKQYYTPLGGKTIGISRHPIRGRRKK